MGDYNEYRYNMAEHLIELGESESDPIVLAAGLYLQSIDDDNEKELKKLSDYHSEAVNDICVLASGRGNGR
jgi:hypothetical protein